MRILIASAPPWACTGYGQQIASLIPRLQKDGHTVGMLPIAGFHGGYAQMNGVDLLPPADLANKGNNDVIEAYAKVWDADIVFSLTDAWVLTGYGAGKFRWVPYVPVDGDPLAPAVKKVMPQAWRIVSMSNHGERTMREAGFQSTMIPHGFEPSVFYTDHAARKQFRKEFLGVDDDAFVFGSVGLNYAYPGRKGFDRLIASFARFAEGKENVYLYLHCDPRPFQSLDITQVTEFYGVQDKVLFPKLVSYLIGYTPEAMRGAYNAMDAFVLATHGEGFGIPVIEALACGIPVIATDCTSMPELVQDTVTGTLVPPVAKYMNPGHYFHYLIDEDKLLEAMEDFYSTHFYVPAGTAGGVAGDMHAARFPNVRALCRMSVRAYEWDQVYAQRWKPFFDDCQREIESGTRTDKSRSGAKLTIGEERVRKTDGPTAGVQRAYEVLRSLDHPNIIKPLETGTDEWGRFWYEMPKYQRTLDEVTEFTQVQRDKILGGLRAALEYMHEKGIAHRDVHESNVLLADDDNPILIDFGWVDACPGEPCVDFEPWKVRERATPRSQLGDVAGFHRVAAYVYGIDLREAEATALAGIPYQALSGAGERDCAPRWELMAPDVKGKRVLDVGCNLGYFAGRALAEGAAVAVGIDHDAVTLEAARKLYPGVEFRHGDLNNGGLPLKGEYGVAFALSVLQHLREPQRTLDQLRELAEVVYVEVPAGVVSLEGAAKLGVSERGREIVRFG